MTSAGCDDKNNYEWGGTFVPHEVFQRQDGTLGVKTPDTVWDAFVERIPVPAQTVESPYARKERILVPQCRNLYSFEADISFTEATRSFGIRILENEKTGQSYQYLFQVEENRLVFEKNPNQPWFSCMNIGLERPIPLKGKTLCHIRLIVDDTVAVLYADGVALCSRVYDKAGEGLGIFVTDGCVEVKNASFSAKIKR